MEKQIVRQLQRSGNRLNVCIAPEVREALQANKGDNLAFEIEPESGVVKLSRVAVPNPGPDTVPAEPNKDNKDESAITLNAELRVDGADKKTENPQAKNPNMDFCPNCGSKEIEVDGSKILCQECDALFESTADGFKVVELSPLAGEINDIEQRLGQVEQDVQEIDEQLNPEPDKDDDEGDYLDDEHSKPWGFIGELVEAVFGTGSDEDKDGDEDDLI